MTELAAIASLKDQISPGLTAIASKSAAWAKGMAGHVSGLVKGFFSLKGAVTGLAAVWGARLFGSFISSTAEAIAEISALSDALGVTTESLSEMIYGLESVGVKQDQARAAFSAFSRAIAQARAGSKAQADAFAALGLSVDALAEGNVDLVEVFAEVSEGLERMGTQAEKTQALLALFGEGGGRFGAFMAEGRDSMRAWSEEAKRFGVSVTAGAEKVATQFSIAKQKFENSVKGIKDAISLQLYPPLQRALERMAEFLADNRDLIVEAVRSIAIGTVSALEKMAVLFLEIANQISAILPSISGASDFATRKLENRISGLSEGLKKIESGGPLPAGITDRAKLIEDLKEQIALLNAELERGKAKSFDVEIKAIQDAAEGLRKLLRAGPQEAELDFGPKEPKGAKEGAYRGEFMPEIEIEPETPEPGVIVEESKTAWQDFTGGMKKGLEDFKTYATDTAAIARDAVVSGLLTMTESMTQGFTDWVTGAKSAKDAFRDMAADMLKQLAQILIRMALMRAMGGIFGGILGGGGGAPAAAFGGAGSAPSMAAAGIGPSGFEGGSSGFGPRGEGSGPVSVNFTILANDSRGFDELIYKRKTLLSEMIQDAISRRPGFRQAVSRA